MKMETEFLPLHAKESLSVCGLGSSVCVHEEDLLLPSGKGARLVEHTETSPTKQYLLTEVLTYQSLLHILHKYMCVCTCTQ